MLVEGIRILGAFSNKPFGGDVNFKRNEHANASSKRSVLSLIMSIEAFGHYLTNLNSYELLNDRFVWENFNKKNLHNSVGASGEIRESHLSWQSSP